MSAIFRPAANTATQVVLLGLATLLVGGVLWWWAWPRMDYVRHRDWIVEQPVPFSHQHHVAGLGIDCRFCHTSVEVSARAGLPPTWTCMTCHSQIWTNADLLAPVRQSLAEDKPIVWGRVNNLPDYVYFNHSAHINNGVGCSYCHGRVDQMSAIWKAEPMTMGWCLECHRNPAKYVRPREEVFNMAYEPPENQLELGRQLVQAYNINADALANCSACHR